eukprot:g3094.t1
MVTKTVIVDARGHLLGRMASVVAKQLLLGQKVVIVRCEKVNISGSLVRNKVKLAQFMRKRTLTNPKRGPIHQRAPSAVVKRTIRGMLPHRTARGKEAFARLQCHDGIPPSFSRMKRMVIPDALRVTRLQIGRKYCVLGRLSSENGWRHGELIEKLEAKRKEASGKFYEAKKAKVAMIGKARKDAELDAINQKLAAFGYVN